MEPLLPGPPPTPPNTVSSPPLTPPTTDSLAMLKTLRTPSPFPGLPCPEGPGRHHPVCCCCTSAFHPPSLTAAHVVTSHPFSDLNHTCLPRSPHHAPLSHRQPSLPPPTLPPPHLANIYPCRAPLVCQFRVGPGASTDETETTPCTARLPPRPPGVTDSSLVHSLAPDPSRTLALGCHLQIPEDTQNTGG